MILKIINQKEETAHLSIGKIGDITTRTADPRMKLSPEQSQLLEIPTCSKIPIENFFQTPRKLPPATSSSSSAKVPDSHFQYFSLPTI